MNGLPRWLLLLTGYCVAILVVAATVWLAVHALSSVLTVSFSIAAALLLAALALPLTDLLSRLHLPRWLAALLTVLALVGVVLGSFYWVVRRAADQVPDLRSALTDANEKIQHALVGPPLNLSRDRVDSVGDRVVDGVQGALPTAMSGATIALHIVGGVVLVIFLLFFLLLEGDQMWEWALGWFPARRRAGARDSGALVWETLTRYVRGTVVVAFVDAIGIGAGMLLLGNPLVASLTLITFLGAFVPIVGATVSGVLAVGVTLVTNGPWAAVVLLGVVVAVQQLEGNLLQPLIMGRALRLNPVAIVLSVSVGGLLGGIVGAVVAVPVVAVVYRLVSRWAGRESPDAPPGAD